MNLSSIVIRVKNENADKLQEKLVNSGLCQCHLYKDGKLIITIEGENTEEELRKLNTIKQFDEVIAADLIYTYSENELEQARENIEMAEPTPDWLNDNEMDAKEIKYNGDLRN